MHTVAVDCYIWITAAHTAVVSVRYYSFQVGGNGHRRVTALAAAARKGHLEVMRLLLQSKKVTVHQRDRQVQ